MSAAASVEVCRFQYLINEYAELSVNLSPSCSDFEEHPADFKKSPRFTWSGYNGRWLDGNPNPNKCMIKASLTTGLETTRTNYGKEIVISSGYRSPKGSQSVNGVANSFHMHGRAVDLFSVSANPWTEAEFNLMKDATIGTNPIEAFSWGTYSDHHFHAAW